MARIGTKAVNLVRAMRPDRLAGPLLLKELRVAGRRRRYYLFRSVYISIMALFVVMVWLTSVPRDTGRGYEIARMGEVGKHIIATVVWVQFLAAQMVAVILMGSSISEEVYHRTMPVLLTTPVSSFQIVSGKLLSRLWQLFILLAISLPLLGVVRVFGGVPWSFVIAGFCVTLVAAMFAGLVTMFYSAIFRRAYASILLALATGFVLYAVVPNIAMLMAAVLNITYGSSAMALMSAWPNPMHAMGALTMDLYQPGMIRGPWRFSWMLHCLIMLGLCGLMTFLCSVVVRKVTWKRAFGDPRPKRRPRRRRLVAAPPPAGVSAGKNAPPVPADAAAAAAAIPAGAVEQPPPPPDRETAPPVRRQTHSDAELEAGKIREIRGSPLLWRELRQPLFRSTAARIVIVAVTVPLALLVYLPMAALGAFDQGYAHAPLAFLYVLIPIVGSAVLASTNVTSEKEARTLSVLLASPLDDAQIVRAKIAGATRRSLPLWAPLFIHLGIFVLVGKLEPHSLVLFAFLAVGTSVFVTTAGVYFGCRCRRTITAVIGNLSFLTVLWILLPVVLQFVAYTGPSRTLASVISWLGAGIPPIQAAILAAGGAGGGTYEWTYPLQRTGVVEAAAIALATMTAYVLGAVVLGAHATKNLRPRAL